MKVSDILAALIICDIATIVGRPKNASCAKDCVSCTKDNVCKACKDGFFLFDEHCKPCPVNCERCHNDYLCLVCVQGFKGKTCSEKCDNCQEGTKCDKETGFCIEECREGSSGLSCDRHCNIRCRKCDRLNENLCTECAHNTYGTDCSKNCSSTCKNGTCDDSYGKCLHGCQPGFWGDQCLNHYENRVECIDCMYWRNWFFVALSLSVALEVILFLICYRQRKRSRKDQGSQTDMYLIYDIIKELETETEDEEKEVLEPQELETETEDEETEVFEIQV